MYSCAWWTNSTAYIVLVCLLTVTSACTRPAQLRSYGFAGILWSADFHPSGTRLATAGNAPSVRLYDAKSATLVDPVPVAGTVTRLQWHPAGSTLAVALQVGEEPSFLWNPSTREKTYLDSISADGARGLAWSPDGSLLAVGDNSGSVLLYSADGQLVLKRQVDPKAITDLSWHPGGDRLTSVGSGIGQYDRRTDSVTFAASRAEQILMLSVAWHPGGDVFVTGDYGDQGKGYPPLLQTWTADGQLLRQDSSSRAEIRNIQWSPDGTLLASASDGLRMWSSRGQLLGHVLAEHYLWGLAWAPQGTHIAVTSGEGRTFVLDRDRRLLQSW